MINTLSGYYMSTANAAKELRFKSNDAIFSFSQFDLQFNRPDKVFENMGTVNSLNLSAYQRASTKRIRRMGFDPEHFVAARSDNIPEIKIVNRLQIPVSSVNRSIKVNCLVHDALYTLDRLNIYVNGVPVYGINGLSLRSRRLKNLSQELIIRLSNGSNLIGVSVTGWKVGANKCELSTQELLINPTYMSLPLVLVNTVIAIKTCVMQQKM